MPISKYNPDGTVDIYNTKTGEVRQGIFPEELSTISPNLVKEYYESQTPESKVKRVEAETKLGEIESGADTGITNEQKFKLKSAGNAIDRLEQTFGRGKNENVGTGDDLGLAENATAFGKTGAGVKAFFKNQFDSKYQEDLNIFTSALENAKGIFTQAFGSGTPQAFESESLLKNAPNAYSTDKEVKEWFKTVRSFLGENDKVLTKDSLSETPPDLTTSPTKNIQRMSVNPSLTEPKTEVKKKETSENSFVKKVADLAPAAFGLVGGITGGLLGGATGSVVPGAGTIAGGIAGGAGGTVIGTAAGGAVKNMIEDLAGIQDETAVDQIKNTVGEAAVAGTVDALTAGAFRIVGKAGKFVLKPIVGAVEKGIASLPLRSLRINPSQLTKFAEKHGIDMGQFVAKNGLFGENALELGAAKAGELQKSFDNLALNENIKIPIGELNNRFIQEISNLAPSETKLVPGAFKDIAENVTKEWSSLLGQMQNKGITELTPKMLTELRRMTDELIPDSAFANPNVKNMYLRLRRVYNDVIQDSVDRTMLAPEMGGAIDGSGLKDLGQELSKYYDFLEAAEKQSNLGRGSIVPNLTRLLSLGFGASVGGVPGLIGGIGVESALRNPSVLKSIYRAGQSIPELSSKAGSIVNAASTIIPPAVGVGAVESTRR